MLLIITSCINPNADVPFVALQNTNDRLQQYLNTVEWAIYKTLFSKILFIDNSDCDLSIFEDYKSKAIANNKTLEIISIKGTTEEIIRRGKGFGEGEMIEYALSNSHLLSESDYFYKLTGRLLVNNIIEIQQVMDGTDNNNIFMYNYPYSNMLDTRFYKVDKEVYKKYLLKSHEHICDAEWICLEHMFFDFTEANDIKYDCFKIYPEIVGQSGSTGKLYTSSEKNKLFNLLCQLGMYNNKLIFSILVFPQKLYSRIKTYILYKIDI